MMRKNTMFRKYIPSLLLFLLFELVAITLWIAKYNIFYLLNFSYIGGCIALGRNSTFYCRKMLCQTFCAIGGRKLYVIVSWYNLL